MLEWLHVCMCSWVCVCARILHSYIYIGESESNPGRDARLSENTARGRRTRKATPGTDPRLCCYPQTKASVRKDKYEKKLIWYYCDVAYEAVRSDKDEEQISRDTGLGEAQVGDVALGLGASLPNLNSDDEDDVEDDDDDEDEKDDDAEEGKQPPSKLGKRKTKEDLNEVTEDRCSKKAPAIVQSLVILFRSNIRPD